MKPRSTWLRRSKESKCEQQALLYESGEHDESGEWKLGAADDPGCTFWRFDISYLLEEDLLLPFLRRLKQVELSSFFEKMYEIVAPRGLILDFILRCKVELQGPPSSTGKRQLTYSLEKGNFATLSIKLTRESFAEILQLPVVTEDTALVDYSQSRSASRPEWLGGEYCAPLCDCSNSKATTWQDGFSRCSWCSTKPLEPFWLTSEIKDPSIKNLIQFIGVWIHNTDDTSCLRKAAVNSLHEALVNGTGKQIWTQHLWKNFLWDLEKAKQHVEKHKEPYECHKSTAGVISAILCARFSKSASWNPTLKAWERSTFYPGMKTCRSMLKQVQMCEGAVPGKTLQVYQRRVSNLKVYARRSERRRKR
ncbi:hypothetical protein R1flu_001129 [Riccia fluitans]|uniref:Uncharacterized protein n=1 Tax=Riccia fluitans TaxID=41844 RepID=A0ABD1Y2D9_9MARC